MSRTHAHWTARWAAITAATLVGMAVATLPTYAATPTDASTVTVPAVSDQPAPRPSAAKDRFDRKGKQAPNAVAGWWVDTATQQLVVNVVGGRTPDTDRFTADSDPAAVRVDTNSAPVRKFSNLVGGQKIQTSGGYCSIGFSTRNSAGTIFVLTAGHCTVELPGTWNGYNNVAIGPAVAKNFPTDDFGTIQRTNTSQWTPTALVQGGPTVKGSTEAAVNAQVCRSGATSGYHCGVVQAKNQTVNYGGGDVVYGLTRTNACAEPGDSGGTFITPAGQAQGMTSGGSGDCTTGGTTFFQPVNEALSRLGLTLVTG